jgi:hypothetical protein
MPPTLSSAREEFMRQVYRDNVVAERPRLLGVLDAVIAWSAKRAQYIRFRPDENDRGVIRFEDIATRNVFWVATPRRHNVPLLQLMPGSARVLTEEERSDAVTRLNSYTTELNPAGRMRISFGALKNVAGRDAVFELMDELLEKVKPATRAAEKALID